MDRPGDLICPYVAGRLTPATVRALGHSPVPVRFVQLPLGDPGAYGRLVRLLWRRGRTFLICEQDVSPTAGQLQNIATCGHQWCSYAYSGHLYPSGPSFGCVRFASAVMSAHPLAAEVALITGKRRDGEAEWWRVDSLLARDLIIRGVRWTEHRPPVLHLHPGPPSGPGG